MKYKQALAGFAALATITAAHAQSANSFYVATGWFHFAPQDTSDPLTVLSVNNTPANNFKLPGSGAGVGSADTLGLSVGYFITDSLAVDGELGIPPSFDLSGSGTLSPFGKVGSAKLWAPAVLLQYYFNKPDSKFRPYVGLGATYTWFSNAHITNNAFLSSQYLGGPTSVSTSSSWAPVFNVGFNYNFTQHWFAGFSLSYIPVNVTATLTTQRTASPIPVTQVAQAKIHLNPIVTYLKVGYRF